MIKVEILTDTTVEGLQARIEPWTHNGWCLHEGIVVTAWEEARRTRTSREDQPITHSQACGFLQVLVRTEGTRFAPHTSSEND